MHRLDYTSGVDGTADWALVAPGRRPDRWLVMIHGHGSAADQLWTRPDIRDHWLPAFQAGGWGIIAPQLRGNAWMGPAAATDLCDLLNRIRLQFGAARFVFVSGSMGGTSNLIYAVRHPADVAGVVALCPATDVAGYHAWCRQCAPAAPILSEIADAIEASYGGPPARQAAVYAAHSAVRHAQRLTMPVAVVHATGDAVIPVQQSRDLAARLAGHRTFRYVELAGGHHDSPLAWAVESLDWVCRQL